MSDRGRSDSVLLPLARAAGELETALLLAEYAPATNPAARSLREAIVGDIGNAHALVRRAYLQLTNLRYDEPEPE